LHTLYLTDPPAVSANVSGAARQDMGIEFIQ
jgi:hypothetical protein